MMMSTCFTRFRFSRILPLLFLLLLCACGKDDPKNDPTTDPEPAPAPAPEKYRTVLCYMMDDHNLWDYMETTINELEAGWDEQTDGNLLVYLDPSPKLTQFSTPVLLKIVHDETQAIRSEVIKVYPEQNPVDNAVMKGVLEDAIALFPAQSHGLVIGTHGGAWFPGNLGELVSGISHEDEEDKPASGNPSSRALGGGERFGDDLEISDLANLLPIKYDFLMFHACLMANVETAYELREKCNLMVGCMQPLPCYAYPYDEITPFLFTKPQADFYHVVQNSVQWYAALPDSDFMNFNVSVIRTEKLEALAAAAKTILSKLQVAPEDFYSLLRSETLYIDDQLPLNDLKEVLRVASTTDPALAADYAVFEKALQAAVPQNVFTFRQEEPSVLSAQHFSGLSCYTPIPHDRFSKLNNAFKAYKWAAASGFDKLILP